MVINLNKIMNLQKYSQNLNIDLIFLNVHEN